jgi:hypothetical protein
MRKDDADEQAAREKFERWLQVVEAAVTEIVEVGELLFDTVSRAILHCCVAIGRTRA